jgi:hypothetical protein
MHGLRGLNWEIFKGNGHKNVFLNDLHLSMYVDSNSSEDLTEDLFANDLGQILQNFSPAENISDKLQYSKFWTNFHPKQHVWIYLSMMDNNLGF